MEHLTVEEMINFVSFDKLDNESLSLASKVNAHLLRCEECREKVAAFQMVYDELIRIGISGDFSNTVRKMKIPETSDRKKTKIHLKNEIEK